MKKSLLLITSFIAFSAAAIADLDLSAIRRMPLFTYGETAENLFKSSSVVEIITDNKMLEMDSIISGRYVYSSNGEERLICLKYSQFYGYAVPFSYECYEFIENNPSFN